MSKGSTPRPCNREKFEKGWERVFGKKKLVGLAKFLEDPPKESPNLVTEEEFNDVMERVFKKTDGHIYTGEPK